MDVWPVLPSRSPSRAAARLHGVVQLELGPEELEHTLVALSAGGAPIALLGRSLGGPHFPGLLTLDFGHLLDEAADLPKSAPGELKPSTGQPCGLILRDRGLTLALKGRRGAVMRARAHEHDQPSVGPVRDVGCG